MMVMVIMMMIIAINLEHSDRCLHFNSVFGAVCYLAETFKFVYGRLVMYLERDSRHSTPRGARTPSQEQAAMEYLGNCLHLLVSGIVAQVPAIMRKSPLASCGGAAVSQDRSWFQ